MFFGGGGGKGFIDGYFQIVLARRGTFRQVGGHPGGVGNGAPVFGQRAEHGFFIEFEGDAFD